MPPSPLPRLKVSNARGQKSLNCGLHPLTSRSEIVQKNSKMGNKSKPRTIEISDFAWKVLYQLLFPLLSNNRHTCQQLAQNFKKQEKTALETAKLFFQMFGIQFLEKRPRREGGKVQIDVSPNLHFGCRRRPMELRGDFQEHFLLILNRFANSFCTLSQKQQS